MEKANYSSKDIKLKLEGLNLNIDKEVLDDQRALEVSTEVPDKEKVAKDDKIDFENFKVLYANAIKDKCLEEFGVADDDKLLEDTAKEMYLASKTYIPEEDKKADGELEKKTESKKLNEAETKQTIYDELSRVLTDYEGNGDPDAKDDADMLYHMLVKIQNNWEDTITNCEESKSIKNEADENPFKIKYKAMLNGKEVKPGDKIKDFRGDEHIFKGITNPGTPFGGRNGKVQVDFGDGSSVEYYPSVFNIELVRVDENKKVTESIDEEELNDTYSYIQEANELAEKLYDTWNSINGDVREVLEAQYDMEISPDITKVREAFNDFDNNWEDVKEDLVDRLNEGKSIKKECPKQS